MRVGAGPSILVAATMAASLIAASAVAVAPEGGSVAAASPSRPPSGDAVAASGIAPILTPATLLAAGLAVLGMVLLIRHRWWRLELAPPPARRFPATWSVGWAIALLASSVVLGSILLPVITAVLGAPPDLQTLGGQLAVAVPVHLVQGGLILLWWRGGRPDGDRLQSGSWRGPRQTRAAAIGAAGLLVAWPVVVTVTAAAAVVVVVAGGPAPEAIAHRTLALIAADPFSPAALGTVLLVSLLVPWIEEAVYRGMLQRGLVEAGLGRWPAIVLVAGFFAVRHLGVADPHAIAGLFVLGLAFGLVLERTGRLTAAVVMHAAFNAGNVLLAVIGSPPA
jgi:membrane protease YdiL (CAAX protease family)